MAYRFTSTDKWEDAWFANLKPLHKLLFLYLCDNCNIAGFIEYNPKIWAVHIGCDLKMIEEGLKGVERGIMLSTDGYALYIKKFLKHQKNYPFNEKNKAHIAILKCFDDYLHKFECEDIEDFILRGLEGGSKEVYRGPGIGKGIGIGKGKGKGKGISENEIKIVIEYLNNVCDKNFKVTTEASKKFIRARLNDGFTVEDLKSVIDKKAYDWKGTDNDLYLRPETLFNTSKFEGYLNQKKSIKPQSRFEKLNAPVDDVQDSFLDDVGNIIDQKQLK